LGDRADSLEVYRYLRPTRGNYECADASHRLESELGWGNLQVSTLRRQVNRKDYLAAEAEFAKWVFARGVKLPRLVRRRKAEARVFAGQ
jgi:GH24 family phage-related lysozyme (muramidase)